MSDLFDFNGAKGSGWSQPEPMKKDAINTVPASLRRSNLPRWPRASEPELVRHSLYCHKEILELTLDFIHWVPVP